MLTIFKDGTYFNKNGEMEKASLPEMLDELKELTDLIERSAGLSLRGYASDQVYCTQVFMERYIEVQNAIDNGNYKEVNPYGNL